MLWIISLSTLHKVVGEGEGSPEQSFTGENRKLVSKARPNFQGKIVLKNTPSFLGSGLDVYARIASWAQSLCVYSVI